MVRQMHEEDADDEELRKILIERAGVGIEMLKDILYKPELDDERVLSSGTVKKLFLTRHFEMTNIYW